jgi:O-antigen ligase
MSREIEDVGSILRISRRGGEASRTEAAPGARAHERHTRDQRADGLPIRILLWGFMAFLAMEYLRPPGLQPLRLQLIFLLAVPLLWSLNSKRPWSRNLTLFSIYIVTGALAMPFAHNYFHVYVTTRYMLGYLITALATTWLLSRLSSFKTLVWFWVGLICGQAGYALTHSGQGYGTFLGDENDLAIACDMAFPFAYLAISRYRGGKRLLCIAAAALLVAGVVASFSRGGFLGLAAGFAYCVLTGQRRLRSIAIAITVSLTFLLLVPRRYVSELQTMSETETGTAENRFFLWTAATLMWMDHPVFGVGPGNSKFLLGEYNPKPTAGGLFSSPFYTDRIWSMRALHSLYFELLSERGIVGVVLFGIMAVDHYRGLRRIRRGMSKVRGIAGSSLVVDSHLYTRALAASMTGLLVAGGFLSMLNYPYFWFFGALAVALDRAVRGEYGRAKARSAALKESY